MKLVIGGLVALFVGAASWPQKPAPGVSFPGKVVSVYDGDTMTVEVTTRIHMRLDGVWAPEVRGKEKDKGLIAKAKAQKLAPVGKPCIVWVPFRGDDVGDITTLGRVVGTVWMDGQDKSLNEQLVEAGYGIENKGKW